MSSTPKSRGGYAPAPSDDKDETESIYSTKKGGKAVTGKSAAQRRWRNVLVIMFAVDFAANAGLYQTVHEFNGSCESDCCS